VLGQERNVRHPHAVQAEGFVEADRMLERDQMLHQPPTDLQMGEAAAVDAERLGNHLEALRRRVVVERHHMLHQHRVAQAVRQVEEAAEAVGHGMHCSEDWRTPARPACCRA